MMIVDRWFAWLAGAVAALLILSGGAERGPIFQQVSYLPKSVERFPTAFLNSHVVGVADTLIAPTIPHDASRTGAATQRIPGSLSSRSMAAPIRA